MKNDSTLAYLRRLNPVPEAASVDGAELFERITSLPRDEPAARGAPPPAAGSPSSRSGSPSMALLATTALADLRLVRRRRQAARDEAGVPERSERAHPPARSDVARAQRRSELGHLERGRRLLRGDGRDGLLGVLLGGRHQSGDEQAQQQSHAELTSLLRDHVVIARRGRPRTGSPTGHRFPVVAFADDGGYQYKQQMYADAGGPKNLIQSCRANGPYPRARTTFPKVDAPRSGGAFDRLFEGQLRVGPAPRRGGARPTTVGSGRGGRGSLEGPRRTRASRGRGGEGAVSCAVRHTG